MPRFGSNLHSDTFLLHKLMTVKLLSMNNIQFSHLTTYIAGVVSKLYSDKLF